MTLKIKLIITACLTAFLAVIVGAVVNRVNTMQAELTALAAVETVVPTEEPVATEPVLVPTVSAVPVVDLALVQEREAAYQAQLAEANQRLAVAAARLAEAQGQANTVTQKYNDVINQRARVAAVVPVATDVAAPTTVYMPIEAVTAIARALDADAVLQKAPELVLYQDQAAYELVFDRGTVYIGALDGTVLTNGMAGFQTISATTSDGGTDKNVDPAPTTVPEPPRKPEPTAVPAPEPDDNEEESEHEDSHEEESEHEDSHDEDAEDGEEHD
ncbi:MAG: hypothetical protein RLY87_685 [Chloroflexota bacterium]|jgi:hypothetical protein